MRYFFPLVLLVALLCGAAHAQAKSLKAADKKELKDAWQMIEWKRKGPFTINYCTCTNGKKAPVADKNMRIRANACAEVENSKQLFCSAYRAPWAGRLTKYGMFVANIFSNEVYEWEKTGKHNQVAKGFILEKFYMETHPDSKLTTSRAFSGISGAEFELVYTPKFFAKLYAQKDWSDFKNYFVQYELQRRFFLSGEVSQIHNVRNQASRVYGKYPKFKPMKDLVHNNLSPGLIPMIKDYVKRNPGIKKHQADVDKLIAMLSSLTKLNVDDLKKEAKNVETATVLKAVDAVVAIPKEQPLQQIHGLAKLAVIGRNVVAKRNVAPEEAVDIINLVVTANSVMHMLSTGLIENKKEWSAGELLTLMKYLSGGIYGSGLISGREFNAMQQNLNDLLKKKDVTLGQAEAGLTKASRVVEWAQNTISSSFADVWQAWVFLLPDVTGVADDIIRSSPLLTYAEAVRVLRSHLMTRLDLKHDIYGTSTVEGVRALNPGLAMGPLALFKGNDHYTRDNILALESTNEDIEPVAGIVTKDEGNVVSHVQLLARALGVPNAVFYGDMYTKLQGLDGEELFYAITPLGKVILKKASDMSEQDKTILAEYQRNKKRRSDADVRTHKSKLQIDADELDLAVVEPKLLDNIRRKDSGVICGPKAAFLGELRHLFPDNVANAVVLPFGIYNKYFQAAKVLVPKELKGKKMATDGESLPEFVRATYDTFFNKLLPDSTQTSETLAAWIKPRLEIIQNSIMHIKLDPAFVDNLRNVLQENGFIRDAATGALDGVFVRSDTNVEDMPNFNGAGLNLTLFNLTNYDKCLKAIKKVWASPFTFRSFSWRQSVISDPNLVFPSIVIQKAISSEKSGVLITADVDTGDTSKMTIATAEGVGGSVDGTPAETLLFSSTETLLLSQYKENKRRMLKAKGGIEYLPSTGKQHVLSKEELKALTDAATKIEQTFKPESSLEGNPLPWDIEYGFAGGKLWIFQSRPFVGNSDISNLPALNALDGEARQNQSKPFSLSEKITWQ